VFVSSGSVYRHHGPDWTGEDEALKARTLSQPFENVHGAHEIDIDDPGGIFGFGLALCLGGTAARDGGDGGAVNHVADIV
ncbi:hypothetical protein AB9F42_35660, partial [Rhizobium leguminosarum]|uniref:hypothetical protein n=1 Tax=Rhizobium leguminosarum TaxID=384 RepID=UPI003F95E13F